MPEAQCPVEIFPLADREDAGRRDDPIVPNDHATIMKRCLRKKNRYQKFLRHVAVDIHTTLGEGSNRGISLYRQQRADLPPCKFENRFGNNVDRFFFLGGRRKKLAAAKFRQGSTQLRLKDNDQGDSQECRSLTSL